MGTIKVKIKIVTLHCKFKHMKFLRYCVFFVVLTLVLFTNCAKRGSIDGGPIDSLPPVVLSSNPENFSTDFSAKTIQINFDEYVKLHNVNQQLIISPPMETQPEIIPMGYASKYLRIKISDTLKDNTTYSFNFGESIQDNNEGNPLLNFKYVFSTGSYIDSLTLNTQFSDAYSKKPLGRVNVMLYEAEGFTDSTVYKKKPLYVASVVDSLKNVTLENLKEGAYYLIALEEKNSNYRFDPKSDKIGFHSQIINIPTDSVYHLTLFKEDKPSIAYRPMMVSQNKWLVAYEGNVNHLNVSVLGNNQPVKSAFVKVPNKDSIYVFTPLQSYDSLQLHFKEHEYERTHSVNVRTMKVVDSMQIRFQKTGTLKFRDTVSIATNTPVERVEEALIQLIKKDSTQMPFATRIDTLNNAVKITFDWLEDERYALTLLPGSLTDFYGKSLTDTLTQIFRTENASDYGAISFDISGEVNYPIIFELLDKNEDRYDFRYLTEPQTVHFQWIDPGKYFVRIIEDKNGNGKWDTGSYLEQRPPEKVYNFSNEIDLRANWELNERLIIP